MAYGRVYRDPAAFEAKLRSALERVRVVLNANKAPQFASDIHHRYEDKFYLAECMTNAAVSSLANTLASLGLTAEHIATLISWVASGSAASLRFRAEERCNFAREETREVESPQKEVKEVSIAGAVSAALTSKVVTTATDYFWRCECAYELLAVRGAGAAEGDKVTIFARSAHCELKTSTQSAPHPAAKVPAITIDADITWLLRQLRAAGGSHHAHFSVDRQDPKCHTPRRNPAVDEAHRFFDAFETWAAGAAGYLTGGLALQPDSALDMRVVAGPTTVFVPVLPLLAEQAAGAVQAAGEDAPASEGVLAVLPAGAVPATSPLLAVNDLNSLLAEESRQLREKSAELTSAFPGGDAVSSAAEAVRIVTLRHCAEVCAQWTDAVDYVEGMLRKQLIAAIGKVVTPSDFQEYMVSHSRKLFADAFAPSPFCFPVRRSERHSPEGTVSIEQSSNFDASMAVPIVTICARGAEAHPMRFPLGASTNVSFNGERYLHAWLSHRFSDQTAAQLSLVARARQFSSMLVLVGRIASASVFEPKFAAIVKNKDELSIPLDLSTIPTPKEFKDAIESLSPEQKAFAQAFRTMQLESTLFGVLVIHIKPQLERVLNLPEDSLTKEIKLTQDLMQLFIEYQIPSDLLSFDAADEAAGSELVGGATAAERLAAVKAHVQAMREMIEASKQEGIQARKMEATWSNPEGCAEDLATAAPGGVFGGGFRGSGVFGGGGGVFGGGGPPGGKGGLPPPPMCAVQCSAPAPGGPPPVFGAAKTMMAEAAPAAARSARAAAPLPASGSRPAEGSQPPAKQPRQEGGGGVDFSEESGARDYTRVPMEMDARFERLDSDKALRPTIISPGEVWTKSSQKALLSKPSTTMLRADEQKAEKDAAFDLLDALTKSGALPIEHASLHVVVAATHCFDKTVMETVVQEGSNPIERVERSTLIMATTVHQQPARALVRQAQLPRVLAASPALFDEQEAAPVEGAAAANVLVS